MKGRNEIRLCPSEVREALQEWADRRFVRKVDVRGVKSASWENTTDTALVVHTQERPGNPPKAE